ncbi:MAG TPA: SAM-dependent methyltransferase [Clostridiales bacterium]|nr:SAM-dependent methyltransferase [Clostridiales bacterium]
MRLSPRLQAVTTRVQGEVAADVGTDHGHLAAYLLDTGRCSRVIAIENAPGPAERAQRHLARRGGDRAELRRGHGLDPLAPGEADVAIIAGLGGDTMVAILAGARDKASRFILQPMTRAARLRAWLVNERFLVVDEDLIDEGRRLYDLLVAVPGGPGDGVACSPPVEPFQLTPDGRLSRDLVLEIGPLLLAGGHRLLPRRLRELAGRRQRVAAMAALSSDEQGRGAALTAAGEIRILEALYRRLTGDEGWRNRCSPGSAR